MKPGKICVGAIEISTNRAMRLKTSKGEYQDSSAAFQIGQIWDLTYRDYPDRKLEAPHMENVYVYSSNLAGQQANLASFLKHTLAVHIWRGSPDTMFDGVLQATIPGAGYISRETGISKGSTGF